LACIYGGTRGRLCTTRYLTACRHGNTFPQGRMEHASKCCTADIADKDAAFPLGRKKNQYNKTNVNNHGSTWPGLGRHHPNIGTSWRCPCRAADRKLVSQSLGSYSRRPCSRLLEERREHPSVCPRCCHPSHRTAAVQRHRIRDSMVCILCWPNPATLSVAQGYMCRMKLRARYQKGERHRTSP